MKIEAGFTLIEILLTIGLLTVLTSLVSLNLTFPQTKSLTETSSTTLMADIKHQQMKAMVGATEGGSKDSFGIYFSPTSYILFKGTSFNSAEPNNYTVNLEKNVALSNISFPSGQLVFSVLSGEVANFDKSANSLVIANANGENQVTLSVNRYGAITKN